MRVFSLFLFHQFCAIFFAAFFFGYLLGVPFDRVWPFFQVNFIIFGLSAITFPLHRFVSSDRVAMMFWWPYL